MITRLDPYYFETGPRQSCRGQLRSVSCPFRTRTASRLRLPVEPPAALSHALFAAPNIFLNYCLAPRLRIVVSENVGCPVPLVFLKFPRNARRPAFFLLDEYGMLDATSRTRAYAACCSGLPRPLPTWRGLSLLVLAHLLKMAGWSGRPQATPGRVARHS